MKINDNEWLWVVVFGQDGNEQMLGQHDEDGDILFIPCFLSKEEAINGLGLLSKNPLQTYSVQAILFEDLKSYSKNNGFMVFILKESGEILDKVSP